MPQTELSTTRRLHIDRLKSFCIKPESSALLEGIVAHADSTDDVGYRKMATDVIDLSGGTTIELRELAAPVIGNYWDDKNSEGLPIHNAVNGLDSAFHRYFWHHYLDVDQDDFNKYFNSNGFDFAPAKDAIELRHRVSTMSKLEKVHPEELLEKIFANGATGPAREQRVATAKQFVENASTTGDRWWPYPGNSMAFNERIVELIKSTSHDANMVSAAWLHGTMSSDWVKPMSYHDFSRQHEEKFSEDVIELLWHSCQIMDNSASIKPPTQQINNNIVTGSGRAKSIVAAAVIAEVEVIEAVGRGDYLGRLGSLQDHLSTIDKRETPLLDKATVAVNSALPEPEAKKMATQDMMSS